MTCLVRAGVLCWACAWFAGGIAQGQSTAMLTSGQTLAGRLSPAGSGFVFTSSDGKRSVPSALLREIRFNSRSPVILSTGPLRQIGLPGGDAITGELLNWQAGPVALRLRGQWDVSLSDDPRVSIGNPGGYRTVLYDDLSAESPRGESESHSPPACLSLARGERRWSFPEPIDRGLVQIWWSGELTALQDAAVELLGEADAARLRVHLNGELWLPAAGRPPDVHPLRAGTSWRCLSFWLGHDSIRITIDGRLVVEENSAGPVRGLRVSRSASTSGPVLLDDVLAVRSVESRAPALLQKLSDQDVVRTLAGDEFFGRLIRVDPLRVRLETLLGTKDFDWRDLHDLNRGARPAPGQPVAGLVGLLELTTPFGLKPHSREQLRGAISQLSADHVQFEHPYLGSLKLPIRDIHRFSPEFTGRFHPLDLSTHHLGDEVRPDFSVPRPEGAKLSLTWTIAELPAGDVFLSVRVMDLEPAGVQTASTSPFLGELREGHLVTLLQVNGQNVTELNRHVNHRATALTPSRLRIPIPRRMLKSGANTIEFVQKPRRGDPANFDDCQVSHMAVELVAPRP